MPIFRNINVANIFCMFWTRTNRKSTRYNRFRPRRRSGKVTQPRRKYWYIRWRQQLSFVTNGTVKELLLRFFMLKDHSVLSSRGIGFNVPILYRRDLFCISYTVNLMINFVEGFNICRIQTNGAIITHWYIIIEHHVPISFCISLYFLLFFIMF